MTKQELVKIGFRKIDGPYNLKKNNLDFYYYTYPFIHSKLKLKTPHSNEIKSKSGWYVDLILYDTKDMRFYEARELQRLINILINSEIIEDENN